MPLLQVSGSELPRGYFRWPDRHMVRMGTPVSAIRRTSSSRSSALISSRASFWSVSSMLISTKSKPASRAASSFSRQESVPGMAFS